MGHMFKQNGIDVRKLRCTGAGISRDPSELFDTKFIGLHRGRGRYFLKNFP